MSEQDIWYTETPAKPHWPKGVRPMAIGSADLLGMDSRRNIYFDGKRLAYGVTLTTGQTWMAWVTAGSTVVLALMEVVGYFWPHCK